MTSIYIILRQANRTRCVTGIHRSWRLQRLHGPSGLLASLPQSPLSGETFAMVEIASRALLQNESSTRNPVSMAWLRVTLISRILEWSEQTRAVYVFLASQPKTAGILSYTLPHKGIFFVPKWEHGYPVFFQRRNKKHIVSNKKAQYRSCSSVSIGISFARSVIVESC